jgi:hypothetical protein
VKGEKKTLMKQCDQNYRMAEGGQGVEIVYSSRKFMTAYFPSSRII